MSNTSAQLVWSIIRDRSCFLEKRKSNGGVSLSREPLNIKNLNAQKYSGLVNKKAVGIRSTKVCLRSLSCR